MNKQGEAALKRLTDVHDIHVPLCPALLSEFNGMKFAYSHTITRQYMLASAAFLEDRRVLYAPDSLEVPSHCVESVLEIRRFLSAELG